VCEAEVLALRVVELTQAGRSAVAEAAANKVFHTELCQEIAAKAFEWGGTESLVHGARVQQLWLQSLWETIGGGTSEVMRGVVAKQALGLGGRS
jgi:alkylation response protein AidB-like acyl-CoA dehydrogenase